MSSRRWTLSSVTAVALFLLVSTPAFARAQSRPDSLLPPVGSWGVEGSIGGYQQATLLRMTTPRSAWLLGASFGLAHERSNFGAADVVDRSGFTQLRVGRRWWRRSAQGTPQPLLGAGITGALSLSDHARWSQAGAYAEAGATYFLLPRVGVSSVGEMNVAYSRLRQFSSPGGPGSDRQRWTADGYLVRLALAVFF